MERSFHISRLFARYLQGELDAASLAELDAWRKDHEELSSELTNGRKVIEGLGELDRYDERAAWAKIADHLTPVRRIHIWKRWMVAAAMIAVLLGSYFVFFNNDKRNDPPPIAKGKDVEAPTITKATIRLADGRQISVDSLTSIAQGDAKVMKDKDGKIHYSGSNKETIYNTLVNPRGSSVATITLNDGTKVWLNSESSLRYPVSFNGDKREVEITGEVYFQVTKSNKKFIVTGNGVTTEVLGTHFNINTYPDESSKNVTLLEGRISVNNVLIQPGQQAQVSSTVKVISNINVDAVIAWKNGFFSFQNASTREVMRQVSRWYDVEVVFEGAASGERFNGEIDRSISLTKLLDNLAKARIHFRIEGKRLIVQP